MITEEQELRVVAPGKPPRLTPGAARVLLRILRKAAARIDHSTTKEQQ